MGTTVYDLSACACCNASVCGCINPEGSYTAEITGCASASVSLTHSEVGGNHFWGGTFTCNGNTFYVTLECNNVGNASITVGDGSTSNLGSGFTLNCSPFSATATVSSVGLLSCCGGGDFNVSIS